ncbi:MULTISPECIES: LysR family transcriptional regulator [Thalassospira]|uniref:LysR family transcriptional regulator n=1 Tax=Thalassospira TaxID=168934 RepID=UPI0008DDBCD9|nr:MULTISPECIES: LysR family transcriptional regulator [Thalassospira]MAB34985.1 LysR family transcriptional regulator [Thalassospira sp.]MDM7976479.1 LysR family transcriptional regulator [Thalassospira xiamenensis]OHY97299.1 LysR family transcriptional regulator [Thalassospira sp. MIT1004]
MELRHIRYFLEVAREGNFTRAAARIGIGQPPLSQQIRDLETEIGTQLFHRVPHGAELTEAGIAFRDIVQHFPELAERAIRAARRAGRGEIGSIRVGFTASAAFSPSVPRVFRDFRRAYPGVEMTLEENNSARLLNALMDEQLDAVFLRQGAANSDAIKLHRLKSEPMLIVLPAGHPAARHETVALETLRDDALILTPRQVGPTHFDIVVAACRAAGFEPVMGQSAPQLGSVINFVAAELGFSLVPAAMAQLQVNGVVYRKVAGDVPMAHLALAYRSNDISTVLRNFVSRTLNAHHNAETEPTG